MSATLPSRLLKLTIGAALTFFTLGLVAIATTYLYFEPRLPSIEALRDVRLQVPLRIYTRDGALIGEFGEWRRIPIRYAQIPARMVQAFLAAEDDRFFEHPGVDYQGLVRAALKLARTGEKRQGGSTITMQVARNFFLSSEKTFLRKFNEVLLALKIERELTKEEILELYLNKIYLGNRAYGVAAAAQTYYGVPVAELDLAQTAMIAGLPKAPSRVNPIADPVHALARRDYVLGRMRELKMISDADYRAARAEPDTAYLHTSPLEVEAPYIAEMVRARMVEQFGPEAYTGGYSVYTTLERDRQHGANVALRRTLLEYDRRHGYRGPERHVELVPDAGPEQWRQALADTATVGGLVAALVLELRPKSALIYVGGGGQAVLEWSALQWARAYIDVDSRGPAPKSAADVLHVGDVIRLERLPDEEGWRLAQLPEAEAALVALDPRDGAVVALVGGFDFFRSKFNRVTQARRQPGSGFKPFLYSAALAKGLTPASMINDAPLVFEQRDSSWRPENYGRRFYGPTRLREALTFSRNLVSIRLLRDIGIDYAVDYVTRFGFQSDDLPRNLSLALGTGVVRPLDLAAAYAVFANGGYRISPFFIEHIESSSGETVLRVRPEVACSDCEDTPVPAADVNVSAGAVSLAAASPPDSASATSEPPPVLAPRVISAQNCYLMDSMMGDVVRRGTARRAMQLGRHDIMGKTGTTNDQRDAWFNGFNLSLVASAWVGFDHLQPLGKDETGGRAALPMWMDFMGAALKDVPERQMSPPRGLVTMRIDPDTGMPASADDPDAIFETFMADTAPSAASGAARTGVEHEAPDAARYSDPLF